MFKKKQFNIPMGGCLPSPKDNRDVLMSDIYPLPIRIAPEMPEPFDLSILNQGQLPACVGFSSAAIKQEKEKRERVDKIFDGAWIYNECKKIDGMPSLQGTFLRIAMKVLQKQGAKPKDEADSEAFRYRIGGYAQVDDVSFDGLKRAIFVNGILLAGFAGSNAGWQNQWIRPPKTGEATWGHAICICGYTKEYLIFQNSWGENWGEKGIGYIPKDYLPFEAWAILTDLPNEFLIGGQKGFVAQEYLKFDELLLGDKVSPTARLILRDAPAGNKILTLEKGQGLIVIGETIKSGNYNWVKVAIK